MEKLSPNKSLANIKKNYYALAKQVQGIESRVLRLEDEDMKQRKRLENLKNRNHHFHDVKVEKEHRQLELQKNQQEHEKTIQAFKIKNNENRLYHTKVVSELKDTINQQRKTNFKEIREERDRNEKAIRKTKQSFLKLNRSVRDRVLQMENQSKSKIKNYWEMKEQEHIDKIEREAKEFQAKISKLKKIQQQLESREKFVMDSLQKTQNAARAQKNENIEMDLVVDQPPKQAEPESQMPVQTPAQQIR